MRSRRRGSRSRFADSGPEITLTPLIDTALTLLVIFMLTAPVIQHAVKLELPKSSAQGSGNEQQELVVSVDANGAIYFNKEKIALADLGKTIKEYLVQKNNPQEKKSVLLRVNGDTTTCSTLIAVIDNINGVSGIKDVKIDTQKTAQCT